MRITSDSINPQFRYRGDANFSIHDVEDTDDVYPKYWGSAHDSGAYVIMKQSDANTFRYYAGRSGYIAAWAARDALTYDYVFNITLDE